MTLSHILILAGLAVLVGVVLWLTPRGTPKPEDFRNVGGETGISPGVGGDTGTGD